MEEIPQRELRNNIAAVLRAAEAGGEYTITVGGRPVARLGPDRPRQWLPAADVRDLMGAPTDDSLLEDIAAAPVGDGLDHDPWDRSAGARGQ